MADKSDGTVVIKIESNALKTAQELGKVQDEFANLSNESGKLERILKRVEGTTAANLPVYEKMRKKLEEQREASRQAYENFKKLADVQSSGLGFGQLSNLAGTVSDRLRTLALQGRADTKEFKDLAQVVKDSNKQLKDAEQAVQNATRDFKDLEIAGINVSNALKAISFVTITKQIIDIGKSAIKTAGEFEQLQTSFKIMAGGAAEGEKLTNSLIDLASKTPMTTQGLAKATQTLLSFGESSENVIKDLQLLGDISGGEEQRFQSLALAFAQIGSTGRLTGQDLLQMVNQGFNPLQTISEKTGKSISQLKKEMSEGKISFDMVKQAMIDTTSVGGRFYGLMQQQSQTLSGRLSTLDDTWQLVAKDIGDMFLPAAKNSVNALIGMGEASQKATTWIKNNHNELGRLTTSVTTAVTAFGAFRLAAGINLASVLATSTSAVGALKGAVNGLTAAMMKNPVMIGGVAVATAIGAVTYALQKNQTEFLNTADKVRELTSAVSSNVTETPRLIAEYRNLASQSKRTGEQEQRFVEIRDKLKEQYPDLLDKYGKEITKQGELSDALSATVAQYYRKIEAQKIAISLQQAEEKYLKAVKSIWRNDRIKAMDEYTAASNSATEALKKLISQEKASAQIIKEGGKGKSGFGSGGNDGTGGGGATQKIKDEYEKLTLEAQKAEKALKAALTVSGGNVTPEVQKAIDKLKQTQSAVKQVEDAYKTLTANGKSNLEQLNFNIQATKTKIEELASSDVVNLQQIREAQTELKKYQDKLKQIQSATVISPYSQAQNQLSSYHSQLQDMGMAGLRGSAQYNEIKNKYAALKNEVEKVDTDLNNNVGLNWTNTANTIKTQLSSALLTPLQEGETAFDRLQNTAFTVIQNIAQEILEKFVFQEAINGFQQFLSGVTQSSDTFKDFSSSMNETTASAQSMTGAMNWLGSSQSQTGQILSSTTNELAGASQEYANSTTEAIKLAMAQSQLAIADAADSAAKIPYVGWALAPAAALATGAAIGVGTAMATKTVALSKFADGGVFENGNVKAFANGGVVSQPTYFPMAGGSMGLMGEAGAEAIMPLRRAANGRLGVEATTTPANVNIYNYSDSRIETVRRPNGETDIFIRRVNAALSSERTQSGMQRALQRNNNVGLQAS